MCLSTKQAFEHTCLPPLQVHLHLRQCVACQWVCLHISSMYKPCGLWVAILALLGLARSWGCFWIVSWSMIKPIGFWYLCIFECCKILCFLQSNGLLVPWHCWGLPGLSFSSHWASDILTLLWLCQELGFELSYLQANGFLICSNQWISAGATWKHSCDWNLTCMFTLYLRSWCLGPIYWCLLQCLKSGRARARRLCSMDFSNLY